jgi:hypothetical protein
MTPRLICVKEFAFGSPKFFPTEKTFLNANIHRNCGFVLQSRVQHPHTHTHENKSKGVAHRNEVDESGLTGSREIKLNPSLNEVKRN